MNGPIPDVPIAAHSRLGDDGVARLRSRYREILTRIAENAKDVARREELKIQADRLNPDAWTEDADVLVAIEHYEVVLASLKEVVGRRRRRRRGGSRSSGQKPSPAAAESGSPTPEGDPSESEPDDL